MSTTEVQSVEVDSDKKLTELMLYVSKQCENQGTFGATKLNKILFFSDFSAFLVTGRPITGADYMRLPKGPAPRRLVPIREELIASGRAAMQQKAVWNGMVQHRLVPLDDPDLSIFSGDEINRVNSIIDKLAEHNAAEVSDLSHELLAWEIAEDGEHIPYEAAFLMKVPTTVDDERRARELCPA